MASQVIFHQESAVYDYIHDILAKIQCAAGIFIAQQARGIVGLFIVSFCHKQGDSHDMMSIGLSKIIKKQEKIRAVQSANIPEANSVAIYS